MKYLTAIAILLSACAPKGAYPLPAPVVKQPPIAAPIQLVAASNHQTELVAVKLQTQVATLQDATKLLCDEMEKGEAEADKLRVQKSATESQLNSMAQLWQEATKRTTGLIADNVAIRSTLDEMRETITETGNRLMAAEAAGELKDREVADVRKQEASLEKQYLEKSKESSDKDKAIKSRDAEIAKMKPVYHAWLWIKWGSIGIVAAWLVIQILVLAGKFTVPPPFNILFKVL